MDKDWVLGFGESLGWRKLIGLWIEEKWLRGSKKVKRRLLGLRMTSKYLGSWVSFKKKCVFAFIIVNLNGVRDGCKHYWLREIL